MKSKSPAGMMTKHHFKCLFAVFLGLAIYGCTTHEWQPRDMNSQIGNFIEADLKPGSPFCGLLAQCKFNLHYFFGAKYDGDDPSRKTILYISGGPGDIVDRDNPNLDFMRIGANVVYFDVRGAGLSTLPQSTVYDQFLRAEYVVEDIETIRKKVFNECSEGDTYIENKCKPGRKAWTAIYAHSWGTIVAQRYAAKYPQLVGKLILSAPVSRGHSDTEPARVKTIVDNLVDIYRNQRQRYCDWPKNHRMVQFPAQLQAYYPETNNFCFLNDKQIRGIRIELGSILTRLTEDYGSISFVNAFYRDLIKEDSFFDKYPYAKEFFSAVRVLEFLGGGQHEGLQFDPTTMETKMSAAFLLGYYLTLDKDIIKNRAHPQNPANPDQKRMQCDPSAELHFLQFFPNKPDNAVVRDNFCKRIIGAGNSFRDQRSSSESLRARSVFGVYDGLTRWIFRMLEREQRLDNHGCFTGKDVQDVALGRLLEDKKVIQEQAKKLGISRFEKLCPWDPALHRHNKPTLILTGKADAVTAGGQANYFFEKALTPGKRVLIEFPGAGHSMLLQVKVSQGENVISVIGKELHEIVYFFLEDTIDNFIEDEETINQIEVLGANLVPRIPEQQRDPSE